MSEEINKTKKKNTGKKSVKKAVSKKVEEKEKRVKKDAVKNESVKKETTKKKSNTVKKKSPIKKEVKPVEIKEEKVKEEEKKEEVILVEKEVPPKKTKKKHSNILLIVLGCIILFLLFACVIVRKWYLPTESYSFDYLNMRMIGYEKVENEVNKLVSKDDKCIITVTSEFLKEDNLKELGTVVKIKDKEWARQDFANGLTLLTYHKDMLYIVQMYSEDNETFKDTCKESFEDIKNTFKFLKNE